MINEVFNTVDTILNKENNGYVTPSEKNNIAELVQNEIFAEYFSDTYKDNVKEKGSLVSRGYGNLAFTQRQKVSKFINDVTNLVPVIEGKFLKPDDLYLIEEDGILSYNGEVIEEVEGSEIGYLDRSIASPNEMFPVYTIEGDTISVRPKSIPLINIRYIRKPKKPRWTYTKIAGKEMFDPSKQTFQDFELDQSEFANVVVRMCAYLGVSIREDQVSNYMEAHDTKNYTKENSN